MCDAQLDRIQVQADDRCPNCMHRGSQHWLRGGCKIDVQDGVGGLNRCGCPNSQGPE